jgi:hypothetical protein
VILTSTRRTASPEYAAGFPTPRIMHAAGARSRLLLWEHSDFIRAEDALLEREFAQGGSALYRAGTARWSLWERSRK